MSDRRQPPGRLMLLQASEDRGPVSWSSRDMGSPRLSQNWEKSPLMWSRTARAVSAGSKMARPAWTGSKRGSGSRFTTA